jgi:cardiolipin synthase
VETGPLHHGIERAVCRAVDGARQHIYMENFTFCDGRLLYKLARARRRGVDVRVVLTTECSTGIISRTNRVTANQLLHAGIRVYLYPGMTHVKAAAVDRCWAYLGTGNFDPLSLRRNSEVGLAIGASPLVGEVEDRLFHPDFRAEWELTTPLPVTARDYLAEWISSFCL